MAQTWHSTNKYKEKQASKVELCKSFATAGGHQGKELPVEESLSSHKHVIDEYIVQLQPELQESLVFWRYTHYTSGCNDAGCGRGKGKHVKVARRYQVHDDPNDQLRGQHNGKPHVRGWWWKLPWPFSVSQPCQPSTALRHTRWLRQPWWKFLHTFYDVIDSGHVTMHIVLGISMTFDTVDHDLLSMCLHQ